MGFMDLKIQIKEKFKLKTKLTETKIQKSVPYKLRRMASASKRRFNFVNLSTGSGDISTGTRDLFPLCFQRKTQQKEEGLPCND